MKDKFRSIKESSQLYEKYYKKANEVIFTKFDFAYMLYDLLN